MPILHDNIACPDPSLEVEVPRQTSWHVPIGSYHSHIRSIKVIPRFSGSSSFNIARITFTVQIPGANIDYLAKVDLRLDLSEGSDLWNLICTLINRKALQDASGETFDLERLVGLPCDIAIDHNTDKAEDYDFPLVLVTGVREEGGLIKTETKCAKTKDSSPLLRDSEPQS
jgi:hypothetical protein